ncbi:Efflux transporter, RND family, MFP subunit [Rhodopirellula maiorica SM1]|uniref:Efflux transporter, RND family, MFP subunit n=1 Tax=Rhodopirellula maiorica SM1 TaxID=1265738 RepID=M5RQG0_9BACT|nr:HlyD family efflux transporter periplasmic adaptor subunit [Rhodopirellula maiorica]EMI21530.1 Efflux transporter, RND family, MFP subunit [Rhodopirellula maiorica SM1]
MKFSLKTLLWGIMIVAAVMASIFAMFPEPIEVDSATASIGTLQVTVQEDGKTRIREKYVVSAPVMGRVSRIELDPGDHCSEDTLLAVILPSVPAFLDARAQAEAKARVQAARAALQRAESASAQAVINNELASTIFDRAERLRPSNAVSQSEFDIAKTEKLASTQAIKTARFDVEIASFELAMAEAAVEQFADANDDTAVEPFEIMSPINGRVLRVIQQSSAVVPVGTPLIELGDPRNLEIEIDVLSTDAVRIKPGAKLTIEHWGGESPLNGYVRVIEPGAFTKVSSLGVEEQRVNVIADFNESPGRIASLGDGYRVETRIVVNELADVLLIPNSALFRHQRKWHVLTIVDGKANLQAVEIGVQNESQTQIVEGLNVSDAVIVYPSDSLTPGTAVRPKPST